MTMTRRHAVMIATVAVLLIPGQADAAGWRCEASALGGSVLGQPLPAVKANPGANGCVTQTAGALTLPVPLEAKVLAASTSAKDDGILAVGGVADISVKALPTLPVTLPEIPIPAELGALNVDLALIPDPLNLLPSSLTLDLRPAIDALLPDRRLPTVDLLEVQAAVSYAAGRCVDGVPKVAGVSQVAGITVLGQALPTNQLAEQTLTLLDTQSIDLSNLDLSLVGGIPAGLFSLPLVGPLAQATVQAALDALPPIQIPATLAQVKVEPSSQTTGNGLLVQRALRAQVSIAGQSIADLALGEAAAGTGDVKCAAAPAPAGATDLALECSSRRLVLIDVFERNGRVQLLGAADRSLAGRTVDIVFEATRKVVASVKVKPDGSFATQAKLPPRRLRGGNLARYRAVIGNERSLNLKLARRMVVTRMTSEDGKVTIAGRVIGPLGEPISKITVKRRLSCTKSEVVGSATPRKDGSFSVTVDAPKGAKAAVYRLSTKVRKFASNPKLFPTYTLPRAVNL